MLDKASTSWYSQSAIDAAGAFFKGLHAVAQPNTVVDKAPLSGVHPAHLSQVVQGTSGYGGFVMREIPLTQGKVALVDDEDYEWLSQWKWCAQQTVNGSWYAIHAIGGRNSHKRWYVHRLIAKPPEAMEVDHEDHDGLHNWRGNLRVCSMIQNHQNRRRSKNNVSGYKGVCWDKARRCWRGRIRSGGYLHHLGQFDSAEGAAAAYNAAALRYFGEFACLNEVS